MDKLSLQDLSFKHNKYSKFVPPDTFVYSGAGQSIEAIAAMQLALPENKKPVIIALYESLNSNGYSKNPDIMEAHNLLPGAFLQIGLQLPLHDKGELEKVGTGFYDKEIMVMAESYKSISLPIFLRIGYEFDGDWNGYEPKAYKKAFRRIVEIFRGKNVENVAFVWNSHIVDNHNMFEWYPDDPDTGEEDGDAYVDWFCYNTMSQQFDATWFMQQAEAHNKPVMIGESSYAIVKQGYSFEECMLDFFKSIKLHGAKGYQYINWEWQVYPENAYWYDWENGRYTDNEKLVHIYNTCIEDEQLLFRDSTYHQPLAMFVHCSRKLQERETGLKLWDKSWDHYSLNYGYNYKVINATANYGNGWEPFWESLEHSITINIDLPEKSKGYLLFTLVKADSTHNIEHKGYRVTILEEGFDIFDHAGGYYKIPIKESMVKAGRLTIGFYCKDAIKKIRIMQIGIMTFHQNFFQAPSNISCIRTNNGFNLFWEKVEGAMVYNIYRNYQLIEMTTNPHYFIENVQNNLDKFTISACSKFTGEGKMSVPLCLK